jgi:hypothetical protein
MALLGAPDTVWTWVNRETTIVAIVLVTLVAIVLDAICYKQTSADITYLLSSDGKICTSKNSSQESQAQQNGAVQNALQQLHHTSMVLPWGLCLEVASVKRYWFQKNHTHLGWVLRNECSERDYRRLCRAVILARKEMPSRKN